MASESDKQINGYEVVRPIGRGGMAVVYLARQTALNRDVALKELSRFHASTPETAERFLRESRLAGSLNHPNIVTVYEYFEDDGVPYIAMEYVAGGSLRPYVGRLTLAQVAGVMEGLLAGLAHAQEYGIVHRDLKPENLMVTSDGRVKIADFGIAKATQTAGYGSFLTLTGTTVGTPMYMAPEQALGHEVGVWTDLYSVGVMAWEHIVGRAPFRDSEAAVMTLARHVNEDIPPAVDANPTADADVSHWIDRMLVKDPRERPDSPGAAWDELEEIVIARLGPRWRREASLPSPSDLGSQPRVQALTPPPTPTPLPAPPVERPRRLRDDSYVTFGRPVVRVADVPPVVDELPAVVEQVPAVVDGLPTVDPRPILDPEPEPGPIVDPEPEPAVAPEPVPAQIPAAPAEPTPWPRRRAAHAGMAVTHRATALAAAMLLAAAIGGFTIARATGSSPSRTPALAERVSSGPISVSLPAGWRRAGAAPVPQLGLDDEIVLSRVRPAGGTLVLGTTGTTDESLLPAGLRAAAPTASTRQTVVLGGMQFYRYLSLTPPGAEAPETVYAVPTTAGAVIGACVLQGAAPGILGGCERVLGTLRVSNGRTLGLGPSRPLAAGLTRALVTLNAALAGAGRRLNAATRPSAQAAAATQLASAYGRSAAAVRQLDRASADTATVDALSAALRDVGAGYAALADAARAGDRTAYDGARGTIASRSSTVSAALQRFVRLGYTVG